MKIDAINIDTTLAKAKKLLSEEKGLSPAFQSTMEVLLMLVSILLNRATLHSNNSSKPPSLDPNRKKNNRKRSNKATGGQDGHIGKTLRKIPDPDEIRIIKTSQGQPSQREIHRGRF